VEQIPDAWVERTFGSPYQFSKITDRGYILFYEKSSTREMNLHHDLSSPIKQEEAANVEDGSRQGIKSVNKTAGASEHSGYRTLFDHGSKNSEDFLLQRSSNETDLGPSGGDSVLKKSNRTGSMLTATIRSFWNPGKSANNEDIPDHGSYGDTNHVSPSKAAPIDSNGM